MACGTDTAQLGGVTIRLSSTQLSVSGLGATALGATIAPPVFPGFSPASAIPWPIGPTTPPSVRQPLCLARFGSDPRPPCFWG